MTDKSIHLEVPRAAGLCRHVLQQLSVGDAEAAVTTEHLVQASLRGVDSHGITLLGVLAERIRSGQIVPGRLVFIRRETPTTAWLDGQHGLGPVLAMQATALAQQKAERCGLAAVSLKDGNYVGALAPFVEQLAHAGLIGVAMANATPRVAPAGGRQGLHGTNPIAWGAPGMDEDEPLVFDAATGHAAARIVQAADEGRPIPSGIALDRDGQPTTDPEAAAQGTLLPVGGALGFGMGLLVDLLTGGLAGAPVGRQVPDVSQLDGPYGCSFFALAINPAYLGGADAVRAAVTQLVAQIRDTDAAEAGQPVRAPGDRARQERAKRLNTGIPFTERRWTALCERLRACAVDVPERDRIPLADG